MDRAMRLLHPVCPFLTEEIWGLFNERVPDRSLSGKDDEPSKYIMRAAWPEADERFIDTEVEREMAGIQEVVRGIRNIRGTAQIHHSQVLDVHVQADEAKDAAGLEKHRELIEDIAACQLKEIGVDVKKPAQSAAEVLQDLRVFVPLAGIIDIDKEIQRHEKKIEKIQKRIDSAEKKLSNPSFVDRAPKDIVEREQEALAELKDSQDEIKAQIKSLKG
jgi:valyl-tRNA synthetase